MRIEWRKIPEIPSCQPSPGNDGSAGYHRVKTETPASSYRVEEHCSHDNFFAMESEDPAGEDRLSKRNILFIYRSAEKFIPSYSRHRDQLV